MWVAMAAPLSGCSCLQKVTHSPASEIECAEIRKAIAAALSDDAQGRLSTVLDDGLSPLDGEQRRLFVLSVAQVYWSRHGGETMQDDQIRRQCVAILRLPFSVYARQEAKRIALHSSHAKDVRGVLIFDLMEKDIGDYAFWQAMRKEHPELAEEIELRVGAMSEWGVMQFFDELESCEAWNATNRTDRRDRFDRAWKNYARQKSDMFGHLWKPGYERYAELRRTELAQPIEALVPSEFRLRGEDASKVKDCLPVTMISSFLAREPRFRLDPTPVSDVASVHGNPDAR
jgi:hypothetical protein